MAPPIKIPMTRARSARLRNPSFLDIHSSGDLDQEEPFNAQYFDASVINSQFAKWRESYAYMNRLVTANSDENDATEKFDPWLTNIQFRRWKESHSWLKKMLARHEMANTLHHEATRTAPSLQCLSVSSLGSENSLVSTSDMIKKFVERERSDTLMQLFGRQAFASPQTNSSKTPTGRNKAEQSRTGSGKKPGMSKPVQIVDAKLVRAYPSRTFQEGHNTDVEFPGQAGYDSQPVYILCVNHPEENLDKRPPPPQKSVSKVGRPKKK